MVNSFTLPPTGRTQPPKPFESEVEPVVTRLLNGIFARQELVLCNTAIHGHDIVIPSLLLSGFKMSIGSRVKSSLGDRENNEGIPCSVQFNLIVTHTEDEEDMISLGLIVTLCSRGT